METGHRPQLAQHFSCNRENGDPRISDCRGLGFTNRPVGRLPPYPNSSSLKEVPSVQPQVSILSVHLSLKGGETHGSLQRIRVHQYLDDWLIRAQFREEGQLNFQIVVDLTQSLGWIINQEKSELQPTQWFSFVGYQYHLHSALVKPMIYRWLKLQDLILKIKDFLKGCGQTATKAYT